MKSNVVLSPHLDDAVFSCWHLLSGDSEAVVVTIFAGVPRAGSRTLWDFLCGESDGNKMMKKRLLENKKILGDLSVSSYGLDYLDEQYKPGGRNIAEIARTIFEKIPGPAAFFAPLAASTLWRHPDHIIAREVGKYLVDQGCDVSFYADIPYMQMPIRSSPRFEQDLAKRATQLLGGRYTVAVCELSSEERLQKRHAMHQYGSQYRMTNLASFGTLGRPANVAREVVLYKQK